MNSVCKFHAARLAKIALVPVLACALGLRPAAASTNVTSSIAVTATVLTACLIASTALPFGNYDPTSTSPTTGSTSVIATCTLSAPYTIALNNGSGSGADFTTGASGRKMTILSGSATLGYNLYQDASYTTVWGTGASVVSANGTGLPQTYSVYGRIPASQTASAGAYLDTVTATLTF